MRLDIGDREAIDALIEALFDIAFTLDALSYSGGADADIAAAQEASRVAKRPPRRLALDGDEQRLQ